MTNPMDDLRQASADVSGVEVLSPAAQAVLDAYETSYTESGLVAALRAAAHEVAPFPGRYPMNEYMEGFRDAKQSVHHQLLAIATELENQ